MVAKFEPQLETARQDLNAAHDEAGSRAALKRIAAILVAYDSELAMLPAPASETAALNSLISADGAMAGQVRALASEPAGARDVASFDAAVQSRAESSRALSLEVTFLRYECQ